MKKTSFKDYDTINKTSYPGRKLKGKDKYQKLYHFTSFDTFVKIWLSKKLKFSSFTNVNDIQESTKYYSSSFNQLPVMCAFEDYISSYKQISFTMDKDSFLKGFMNTMMWGYYGDKTKGVCIEFDYDKITFPIKSTRNRGIVKYVDFPCQLTEIPSDIKTLKQVKKYVSRNIRKLFFQKQKGWKEENEYRVVSNKDEFLNIDDAISCVYLTSCMSEECQFVEKLVKNPELVKYLDYDQKNNLFIPCARYTKANRDELLEAKNDPLNALEQLKKHAWQFYEDHKHDENAFLLQPTLK